MNNITHSYKSNKQLRYRLKIKNYKKIAIKAKRVKSRQYNNNQNIKIIKIPTLNRLQTHKAKNKQFKILKLAKMFDNLSLFAIASMQLVFI